MSIDNNNDAVLIKIDNLNANFLDFRDEMRLHMKQTREEQKELRMEVEAKTQFINIEVDNIKTKEAGCKLEMVKLVTEKFDKPHWSGKLYTTIGAQWAAILTLIGLVVTLIIWKV